VRLAGTPQTLLEAAEARSCGEVCGGSLTAKRVDFRGLGGMADANEKEPKVAG
jgi:hypothetical protein